MRTLFWITAVGVCVGCSAIGQEGDASPPVRPERVAKPVAPTPPRDAFRGVGEEPRVEMRAASPYGTSTGIAVGGHFPSEAMPPVVVNFSGTEDKAVVSLSEDLAVMTHLLTRTVERSMGDEWPSTKLGIPMVITGGDRSVRSMYIENFGALFLLKVNMPLSGSVETEEKSKPETPAESEWNQAREELYGSPSRERPNVQFDPEQIQALKDELITALKNAVNIRGLKEQDFVAISLFGPSNASGVRHRVTRRPPSGQPGVQRWKELDVAINGVVVSSGGGQATVLTVRAKKADVDAFAKGKLDFDGFKKKVESTTYVGNSYGGMGGGTSTMLFNEKLNRY